MIRALLVAVAVAAAALTLAMPAAAVPTLQELPQAPCGSGLCSYHQLSGDDDYWDEDGKTGMTRTGTTTGTTKTTGMTRRTGPCGSRFNLLMTQ